MAYSTRKLFILTRSRFAPCYVHYRCVFAIVVVGMLFMVGRSVAYLNHRLLIPIVMARVWQESSKGLVAIAVFIGLGWKGRRCPGSFTSWPKPFQAISYIDT